MKLPIPLSFDWDKGNLDKNWHKHKVAVKECEQTFFNKPLKIYLDREHSRGEKRFLAYGQTNTKRELTIIFTIRAGKIRIISARNQNKKERHVYENS